MESLHDYQSRSNIDMVRRRTQDLLDEQQPEFKWNDALFMQTLKSIVRKGDVDLFTKSTAGLSSHYKKQRADSLVHRLEEKIAAAAREAATQNPSVPNPHHLHHHQHHHHAHRRGSGGHSLPAVAAVVGVPTTTATAAAVGDRKHSDDDSSKEPPKRRSEHDKWKIVPKKIYDHSTYV